MANSHLGLNSNYKAFTQKKEEALEQILRNYQTRISDLTSELLNKISEVTFYIGSISQFENTQQMLKNFEIRIDIALQTYASKLLSLQDEMNRVVYVMSLVGEAESIARVLGQGKYQVPEQKNVHSSPEDVNRILYMLNKFKYKLLKALELGLILRDDAKEVLSRVEMTYPKMKRYKRPPRVMKRALEEAGSGIKKDAALGFVSDHEWDQIVNEYKRKYIPKTRGPQYVYDLHVDKTGEDYEEWYGWEIEQNLNDSFVQKVRQGQVDAAKQNGFTDMVWIAIVDDKTDECCLWRDGLTVTEIEARLREMNPDDDCEGSVPPVHPNCRCTLAPYSEAIETIPQTDFKDFDSWLLDQ